MTVKIKNVKNIFVDGNLERITRVRFKSFGDESPPSKLPITYNATTVTRHFGRLFNNRVEMYARGGTWSGVSNKLVKTIYEKDLEDGNYTFTIDELKTFAQGTSPVKITLLEFNPGLTRPYTTNLDIYFASGPTLEFVNFTDNDITFKLTEQVTERQNLWLVNRRVFYLGQSVSVRPSQIVLKQFVPSVSVDGNTVTPVDYTLTVTLDKLLEFIPENENSQSFFFTYVHSTSRSSNDFYDRSPNGTRRPRGILGFTVDLDRPPPVSYKIASAPSSIGEGKRQKISVSTVSVPNGTELYWTLNDFNNDFVSSSGSFIITNNKGEFFITASEDLFFEGTEMFDLLIRTDSIEGEIVDGTRISVTDTPDVGPTPEPEPSPFPTPTPDPSLEITTVLEAIKNELSGIRINTGSIAASLESLAASSEASSAVDITPLVIQLTSIAEDIKNLRNLADTTGIRTTSPYEYAGDSVLYSLYVKQAQILNEEDASDEKQQEALQKFLQISQEMLTNFNPDNGLSTGDFDLDNTNEDL